MDDQAQIDNLTDASETAPEYAVIEIFGHRRLAGRIMEVEQYGTKLLRIDVPKDGKFENGFTSQMYGGASLFSVTPCDLGTVEKINKPYEPVGRLTYKEPDEEDGPHPEELDDEQRRFKPDISNPGQRGSLEKAKKEKWMD